LPWTLSDDDNWRKTHLVAGKLWFAGGILIVFLSLFLPFEFMLAAFITIVVIMVIIPGVYSYRLFKAKQSL
ncbi:MAG: SdpI family protein, partial [Flavisolibacter sp.]